MNKVRSKLWTGFALMFLSGLILGAVAGGLVVRHHVLTILRQGSPEFETLIPECLKRELNLDENQERLVEAIAGDLDAQLRGFRASAEPKLREAFESTQDRIRNVLHAEQQEEFDRMSRTFPLWPANFLEPSSSRKSE
jgi:hypothetical protein